MESKLVALKLFLDELDVPATIATLDDRKLVQKAVYIGQLSGVDLGYRFGWYVMGPYSPALTRDYYSLAENIASGDQSVEGMKLRAPIAMRLRQVLPILSPPNTFDRGQSDWLELVASVHYLRKIQKRTEDDTHQILSTGKPHLVEHTHLAVQRLQSAGLSLKDV